MNTLAVNLSREERLWFLKRISSIATLVNVKAFLDEVL